MTKIFKISDKRYAIGEPGKRAKFVVDAANNNGHCVVTGVRGVKPLLDERFKAVNPNKTVAAALQDAIA